jgi:hypothetical protein
MLKWLFPLSRRQSARLDNDRRGWRRRRFVAGAPRSLYLRVGVACWPATPCDLSRGGVSLTVGLRHELGTLVPLYARCSGHQRWHQLLARVVRLERLPDGHWQIACVFVVPLRVKEWKQLLGRAPDEALPR